MLNGLDLFSGIGGLTLALEPWVRPVAYCENDRYAQAVLLSRMSSGALPLAPIWDDVRTLGADNIAGVDLISAGFPCQDISVAGTGAGLGGERSGLFFEIVRLARELRPRFIFLENVPAITTRGGWRVVGELASIGYDCRWTIVSAAELGAPHLRRRWFLLAHANGDGVRVGSERDEGRCDSIREPKGTESQHHGEADAPHTSGVGRGEGQSEPEAARRAKFGGACGEATDPVLEGRKRWLYAESAWQRLQTGSDGLGAWPQWLPQPSVRRGDDGHTHRVDRLRTLGNAVCPAQAREAFRRLMWM